MAKRPRSDQIIDAGRRRLLRKGAIYLCAALGQYTVPGLSFAASRLTFPMPKRPLSTDKAHSSGPRVALVIDDIGNSVRLARSFLSLNLPITFSILPLRPFSAELADEIAARGHEILLHQPMEPLSPNIDPGPGAVYTDFSSAQIHKMLEANICQVGRAIGVNNHMGSKFTADKDKVKQALQVIKAHGLFFIDSLTSNRSVAYKTARRLNMPADHRNVFLDCEMTVTGTVKQMQRLVAMAIHRGKAIGIGHPFPSTLEGIKRFLGSHEKVLRCIQFVRISNLIYVPSH